MNNKVLSILSFLLIIFTGATLAISNDYQSKINSVEKSFDLSANFTPFQVPIQIHSDKKYKEVISAVNSSAKELNLNYVKRVRYIGYKKNNGKLDYSKPIQSVIFHTYTVHPTNLMTNFNKSPQIIKTKSSNLNYGLPGYSAYIMPIQYSEKYPQNREGNFFLETQDPSKFNQFRKILSYKLTKLSKNKISSDDLLIKDPDSITSLSNFDSPDKLNNIFKSSLFFLFAFFIIWIISNARTISIYKLNGFSTVRMFKKIMGKTYILSVLGVFSVDLFLSHFFNLEINANIAIQQSFMLFILFCATITLIDIFQYINFSHQINRKNYNRLNFVALYLIKSFSVAACLITLVPLTQLTISSYTNLTSSSNYSKQKDFSFFYPYITGNDPEEATLGQGNRKNYNRLNFVALYLIKSFSVAACLITLVPLTQLTISSYTNLTSSSNYSKQKDFSFFYPYITGNDPEEATLGQGKMLDDNMYSYLNSHGAIIYDDSYLKQPIADYLKFIKVNPNYLKEFPLYDTSGRSIHLDNNSRDVLLAIPVNKSKSTNARISDIKQISKQEIGRIPNIKIVYISNRYNSRFKSINNGENISKYAVFVTTKNNSSFVERNIMDGGGPTDGLKMPIGSSVESTYNQIKNRLIQYNYYDNYPQLIKISDYNHEEMLINIGDVLSKIITVAFGSIITLILVIYAMILYFKNFKRSIFIKKMNGYNNLKAYFYFWMLMIFQYITITIVMYLGGLSGKLMIATVLIVFLLELLISLIVIRVINSTNWGGIINEQ
ncbi:hypothetical protein AKUG0801_UNKNOWN100090 (plasmid) [Apilactobacillus kunkeei]|nr:hypothetical protein AKUG0801_UNKNOWN100090 [Apilactobacillus kunkeei]